MHKHKAKKSKNLHNTINNFHREICSKKDETPHYKKYEHQFAQYKDHSQYVCSDSSEHEEPIEYDCNCLGVCKCKLYCGKQEQEQLQECGCDNNSSCLQTTDDQFHTITAFITENNQIYQLDCKISGKSSTGNAGFFWLKVGFKNISGTVTVVGQLSDFIGDDNSWEIRTVVDGKNLCVQVKGNGIVEWHNRYQI